MANLQEAFALAMERHQAGDFLRAEQIYRQIIQFFPSSADAWCFLGAACDALGRSAEAVSHYRQAIRLNPAYAAAHYNLALACEHEGMLDQAIASYRQALTLQPENLAALNNLGNILRTKGEVAEAIACYVKVLTLDPDFVECRVNLADALMAADRMDEAVVHWQHALRVRPGLTEVQSRLANAFLRLGRFDEAESWYRKCLGISPNSADLQNGLGHALQQQDKLDEAIRCYRQAIRFRPTFPEAWNNLGNTLQLMGKGAKAAAHYRRALFLRANFAETHCNLGTVLHGFGKLEEAIEHCQEALRLMPDFPDAHHNLGCALLKQGQLELALKSIRQTLRLDPDYAQAWNNLGIVHMRQGQMDDALAAYETALRIKPDYSGLRLKPILSDVRLNHAMLRLKLGDFDGGWPEYECRLTQPGLSGQSLPQSRWQGERLEGRTILLRAEQGLGDTLHFIRYAPMVKQRGGHVMVQCHTCLLPLLGSAMGIDRLLGWEDPVPPFDVYAPLLSLPGIMRTSLHTIPCVVPYLHADANLVERWRHDLDAMGGFKVGIAWQGNPTHHDDRLRSIPVEHFQRLGMVDGVRLFSLQKGQGADQLGKMARRFSIREFGPLFDKASGAFMDTAAVMKNLDLVISCDTAIVHLAGALAVPVWVALPMTADWRWLLHRKDSPWYPTMRLFRQSQLGDWETVFERIGMELAAEARRGPELQKAFPRVDAKPPPLPP